MSSKEHKEKIWKLIKGIKVGMLVTEDGAHLRARPMTLVQDEYDGTLWFFTPLSAHKSQEVAAENQVCVTFSDHDEDVHVSLSGRARLTQDKGLIERFWNPFVGAWFEQGKEDPDVALLQIEIDMGEHWQSKTNKVVQTLEFVKANVTRETPDVGENKKFG